jgi:hypothetical protein
MQDFAEFDVSDARNPIFVRTWRRSERPPDVPHKSRAFHPVGTPVEGDPVGWAIVGDEAIKTVAPPQAVPKTQLGKATLIRRMTSEEVVDMRAALDAHPDAKMAELYRATTTFDTTAPEYPVLKGAFETVLGQARAAEVLEPEL